MGKELPAKHYNLHYPKGISSYWVNLYNKAIELIPLSINIKIAELGCGPGFFAEFLYKKGYENYWGVDFSKKVVELAKERVPSYKFKVGNLCDKNIQKEFINHDVFIIIETLEHIKNDLSIIEAIPKGGNIILSVPNRNDRAHVRYFKSIEQVRNRYTSAIKFVKELIIPGVGTKKFFLMYGIKR